MYNHFITILKQVRIFYGFVQYFPFWKVNKQPGKVISKFVTYKYFIMFHLYILKKFIQFEFRCFFIRCIRITKIKTKEMLLLVEGVIKIQLTDYLVKQGRTYVLK